MENQQRAGRSGSGQKLRRALDRLDAQAKHFRASGHAAEAEAFRVLTEQLRQPSAEPPDAETRERTLETIRRRRDRLNAILDERRANGAPATGEEIELRAIGRALAALAQRWPQ